MRTKLIAPIVTVALSGVLLAGAAGPSNAATAPARTPAAAVTLAAPSATTTPVQIAQNNINGVFTLTNFVNQRGHLVAVGTFTGTVTDAAGTVHQLTNAVVSSAVTTAAANSPTCSILDLTLGPLHLDLLGLVVDLNQVHLTITGQTGPGGNLLGNLLCGIANALSGGQAGGLANLLNRLLGL